MIQKLKEVIVLTAAYYNQTISNEVLLMYVQDLAEFDYQNVIKAYSEYRRNPKNLRMPLPAQIIQLLNPEISDDSLAIDSASRVIEAVSKIGWNNSQQAKEYIGDLGWSAVQAFGGWEFICLNLGVDIQLSTFNAQIRDIAKSKIHKAKLGMHDGPVAIPFNEKRSEMIESKKLKLLEIANIKTIKGD